MISNNNQNAKCTCVFDDVNMRCFFYESDILHIKMRWCNRLGLGNITVIYHDTN